MPSGCGALARRGADKGGTQYNVTRGGIKWLDEVTRPGIYGENGPEVSRQLLRFAVEHEDQHERRKGPRVWDHLRDPARRLPSSRCGGGGEEPPGAS